MKVLILLFSGLVTTSAVAQNGTNYGSPAPTAPVVIPEPAPNQTQTGPDNNGVVLQELSPPQRAGRRGGVYITGAPPSPAATNMPAEAYPATTNAYAATTNVASTNGTGATGSTASTNIGAGASYEAQTTVEPSEIFVPTFNQPGLPGAIGGVPKAPRSTNPNIRRPVPPNNGSVVPPLGAPAGTVGPALPPGRIATPPPGPPATLPGSRVVPAPPPITSPPPPISGPNR
jgi:hypothetical protein